MKIKLPPSVPFPNWEEMRRDHSRSGSLVNMALCMFLILPILCLLWCLLAIEAVVSTWLEDRRPDNERK